MVFISPNCRAGIFRYGLALSLTLVAHSAHAQQTNVGVPFRNGAHSFYENVNVSWGLRTPGGFFRFNAPAPPVFGGFDPNSQATIGGGNGNGFFQLSAGQGANTSFGSQTVSGNMIDGSTIVVGDASLRPFVTSVLPVVASDPSPLRERLRRRATELQAADAAEHRAAASATAPDTPERTGRTPSADGSSAGSRDLSVAAIRAEQAAVEAERRGEVDSLLAKARAARDAGKSGVARIYYQQALRRVMGDEALPIRKELAELPTR